FLYLFERGYESLPDDLENVAENLFKILQEKGKSILPGEGSSVIDILGMIEMAEEVVSLPVFLGILQTVVGQRNALTYSVRHLEDAEPGYETPEGRRGVSRKRGGEIRLQVMWEVGPHEKKSLTEEEMLRTQSMVRKGRLERKEEEHEVREEEEKEEEENLEGQQEQEVGEEEEEVVVMVGVMTFPNLHSNFYTQSSGTLEYALHDLFEDPVLVEAPLVAVEHHTTTTITTPRVTPNTHYRLTTATVVSYITYPTCPEEPIMRD
ncbi:hypothetical protein Hamer_G007048, partial [Homarus americanus]